MELEAPTLKLMDDINEDLKKSNFGLMIVDDGSGRIPGLIFRGVINKINTYNEKPEIRNIFLNLKKFQTENIKDKLEEIIMNLKNTNQKILVVTDGIATGETLESLLIGLDKLSIDFTVVSLGREKMISYYGYYNLERFSEKIFFGMDELPNIDSTSSDKHFNLPGVIKDTSDSIFYRALRAGDKNKNSETFDNASKVAARKDINQLSNIIYKNRLKKNSEIIKKKTQ